MNLSFREATADDLEALVALLADDPIGATREDPGPPLNRRYTETFGCIDADPNNELVVAESDGRIVGLLQLTFIPYLTHTGSWRCLIEGVRIARSHRGERLGAELVGWAVRRARDRSCSIVQLTSDKRRPDALRFYASHGFEATHEGFKLKL